MYQIKAKAVKIKIQGLEPNGFNTMYRFRDIMQRILEKNGFPYGPPWKTPVFTMSPLPLRPGPFR